MSRESCFYVAKHLECIELHLRVDEEPNKSLCVRIRERTGKSDIILGVCYRLPYQEEQLDEASADR